VNEPSVIQDRLQLPRVVAITGASGLIGRRLLTTLRPTGSQLRALIHTRPSDVPVTEIHGDLLNEAALETLVKEANTVVHLAAVAHTRLRSPEEEARAHGINVEGTRRLLNAALNAGVSQFLLLSSAHVYAGQQGSMLRETDPTAGDTFYGALKLEAERLALEAQSSAMRVIILRPCLTYGPGAGFNLKNLLRAIRRGYYVHARNARTERSLASVDTVAQAITHLLAVPQIEGVFNVADAQPVVLEEWVNVLADRMAVRHPRAVPGWVLQTMAAGGSAVESFGFPAPFTHDSLRKLTAPFSLDVSKLSRTGFVWPQTIEQVLHQMIQAEFADPSSGDPSSQGSISQEG